MTERELENLESLKSQAGWNIILSERENVAKKILIDNSQVKNRDLISDGVIVHENAIEVIRENNGKLKGIDHIIRLVETAREKRLKMKDASKE